MDLESPPAGGESAAPCARVLSGFKYSAPPADEVEKKRKNIYPKRAIDNFWDYYNRRLDRLEGNTRKGEVR